MLPVSKEFKVHKNKQPTVIKKPEHRSERVREPLLTIEDSATGADHLHLYRINASYQSVTPLAISVSRHKDPERALAEYHYVLLGEESIRLLRDTLNRILSEGGGRRD